MSTNIANGNSPKHVAAVQQQVNDVAPQSDAITNRAAMILLAVIALAVVIAATAVALHGGTLSEGILTIGATAIGGLAGIVIPRASK
jgi:hypothetical protein